MQKRLNGYAFRTHAEGVCPVGGNIPAHIPRSTVWCGVGAPRSGVQQPPPAHEVARFYLAPPLADDSAIAEYTFGSHQCTRLRRSHCGGGRRLPRSRKRRCCEAAP